MLMHAIVSCSIAVTASGLHLKGEPPRDIPQDMHWALMIDGKNADLGPHGYDGDGFEDALSTLPFLLGSTEPFSWDLAQRIHNMCCSAMTWRTEGPMPMNGQYAECFTRMDCKDQQAAISDLPENWTKTQEGNQSGCFKSIRSWVPNRKKMKQTLKDVLSYYARDSNALLKQGASFDAKLDRLVKMLRQVAWLHAFRNFNGRFRTLLLQREIRHLGLGSGAAMYNNNRDVFFIDANTYKEKILEGIRMLDLSLAGKANAWLNMTNIQGHKEHFPLTVTCQKRSGSSDRLARAHTEQECESAPTAECFA